ncbi:MAG: ParB/RepB/Spo0J family partition protein [Myxococcota bacterium]
MSNPRNALGRGLGALLPGAGTPPAMAPASRPPEPSHEPAAETPTGEIPIDAIDANPDQPRRVFDPAQLESLAASIRVHGVLQPVVVRRVGERYELVVGERRWRASRAAGLESVPAVVADLDSRDRLELALVENVQRHDLNPVELAQALQTLSETGASQEEIGRRVGLERSTVANHLRLLELAPNYQADVEAGTLSMGHAKALLQVSSTERRRALRDRIVEQALSVRAAEDLARGRPAQPRRRRAQTQRDPNLERVADRLRERLQTRVRISGDGERGRIELQYFGSDDLERLSAVLLGDG